MRGHRGRLLGLALLLLPVSCNWPFAPESFNSISGRVRVEVQMTDPNGFPTGTRVLDDVDGVRVYLLGQGGRDSTRTQRGAYRFDKVPAGSWQVAVGVGSVLSDVTNLDIRPKDTLVIRDTLVLGRTGDLRSWPNPFLSQIVFTFAFPADTPAILRVEELTGTLRREVLRRTFVAGAHQVAWDGTSDAGKPLPDGPYAVLLLAGTDRRAEIVVKGP